MKKLLFILLAIGMSTLTAGDTRNFACMCGESGKEETKNSEPVSCEKLCAKDGGWTKKAILSNTDKFKGVICLCKDKVKAAINETNRSIYKYVEKPVSCGRSGKCKRRGWNGGIEVTARKDTVMNQPMVTTVPSGKTMCSNEKFAPLARNPKNQDECDFKIEF